VKKILTLLFTTILSVALLMGLWHYNQSPVLDTVAAIIFLAAMFTHYNGIKNDSKYFSKFFAISNEKDRAYQLDYIRVLAVLLVIVTHTIKLDLADGLVTEANSILLFTLIQMICLSCNHIYIMLSGALLLPYRQESLSSFYKKRIPKVLIPMYIYFLFYQWITRELSDFDLGQLWFVTKRFLQADITQMPHYWLMYTIISLYIVYPFLRYMMDKISYRDLTWLVVIAIAFLAMSIYLPLLLVFRMSISFSFASWAGVAIMGYWMTRPETKRHYNKVIILGLIGILLIFVIIKNYTDPTTYLVNISPIYSLIAMGIFAIILKAKSLAKNPPWIIRFISKYSYSIILIHWWTLLWVSRGMADIHITSFGGFGTIISAATTLFVSIIVSLILDYMVVIPIMGIVRKLTK